MRSVFLACLLAVAGVSAFPQNVDVAPSEGRIVDLWILDRVEKLIKSIKENRFDPLMIDDYEFDDTIIDNRVHFRGFVEDLKMIGFSNIIINSISYNIMIGRLDLDISIGKITISIGTYDADIRYRNSGGNGKVSGKVEIENIRLRGDALMFVYPGSPVTILNINTLFSIDDIRSDLTVSWQCLACWEPTDYSSEANELLNVTVPGLIVTFQGEIGTIIGELIRRCVNNRNWD